MQFGVCAAPEDAGWCKAAGAEFIEGHVQNHLRPMDKAWRPALPRMALAIPLAGYNCLFPAGMKITGPTVNLTEITAYAERACARAAEMGSSFIVFGSGAARKFPDGWPKAKAEAQLVEVMRVLGPIGKAAGIQIVMEPLHRGESNILNSVSEGLEYIRRAAAPGLFILCDFFHFALENEPIEHLDACGRLLVHTHVAEPVGRIPPGQGNTDFRPWFRKLKALGYDGRMSIECNWKDMKAELAPTLEFLRRQWAAA